MPVFAFAVNWISVVVPEVKTAAQAGLLFNFTGPGSEIELITAGRADSFGVKPREIHRYAS
jgi:hypothetical protein